MSVKNRLKEIRMKEYGLYPEEFAKILEVNLKTYYTWENGSSIPSMKEGLRIAKKLNKMLEEIWYLV